MIANLVFWLSGLVLGWCLFGIGHTCSSSRKLTVPQIAQKWHDLGLSGAGTQTRVRGVFVMWRMRG